MKNTTRLLCLCIAGIFLLKLILVLFFFPSPSKFEVHNIALNMISTGEMKYHLNGQDNYNYQFPVYPFLLFLTYKFFMCDFAAPLLNLVFSSATALLAFPVFKWLLLRMKTSITALALDRVAFLSVIALMLHPLITYYSICIVHPFSLDLFFIFLTLYTMTMYLQKKTTLSLLIYGVCLGVAVLDRSTFIVLIFPFLFSREENFARRKKMQALVMILLLAALPSSVWLVRNYSIYKEISLNSATGQNLWLGSLKETGGSASIVGRRTYYALLTEEEKQKLLTLNPVQQSAFFSEKYFQTFRDEPGSIVKMFLVKLKNFWWFRTDIGTEYNTLARYFLLYKVLYAAILFFFLCGIFLLRKKSQMILSFLLTLSLAQSVFYVETRHRIIIEPFMILLAFLSLTLIYQNLFLNKKAKLVS